MYYCTLMAAARALLAQSIEIRTFDYVCNGVCVCVYVLYMRTYIHIFEKLSRTLNPCYTYTLLHIYIESVSIYSRRFRKQSRVSKVSRSQNNGPQDLAKNRFYTACSARHFELFLIYIVCVCVCVCVLEKGGRIRRHDEK